MTRTLILGAHTSSRGDSPKVCEELALRLRTSGWPVLTASDRRGALQRALHISAAPLVRRNRYDVAQVDVYSGRAFLWAEAACTLLRACGKPFVATLHGGDLPLFAQRFPGRVRRLLQRASAVTAPSSYLAQTFAPMRADIQELPNAIELSRYRPRPTAISPSPRLIWLRAFHELYNSILAIETLAELRRELPAVRLSMIGPDRGDGTLTRTRRRAGELSLGGSVSILPSIQKTEVPSALAGADLFINTSRTDNTPVSVIEAMASGLPIVSTHVGGIPRLLEHEVDALLVPEGSPSAMARAVLRITREEGLAARLSRNARKKAERFDWASILPRWQELLTRTARRGGR